VILLARRRHRRQIVPEEELVVDAVEDLAAILERFVDASGDVARQVPDGKQEAAVRPGIGIQPANGAVEVVEAKILFRGQGQSPLARIPGRTPRQRTRPPGQRRQGRD
jgi:hypothetical protein